MNRMSSLFRRAALLFTTTTAGLLYTGPAKAAILYDWTASGGLFPNQVSTSTGFGAVTLTDSASPENPAFVNGALRLSDDLSAENMYYTIPLAAAGNGAALGNLPLTIEFSMRTISAVQSDARRGGSAVAFPTGNQTGNGLQIGSGAILISSATFTAGPSATVDTTDAFHTYRIELGGYAAGSSVAVYLDNAFQFSGSLYSSASDNGATDIQVYFGEASSLSYSVTDWKSFRIYTVPEPSMFALFAVGGLGTVALVARRRRGRGVD